MSSVVVTTPEGGRANPVAGSSALPVVGGTPPPSASWLTVACPPLPHGLHSKDGTPPANVQHLLDFGECTLDSTRTCTLMVTNHSDAPTECTVKYTSAFHTVTVTPQRVQVPARSAAPLTITVQARQLNPKYHKLVLLSNERNPANTISVLVRSANVHDTHGVRFHSQFYEVLNPFVGVAPSLPEGFVDQNGKIKFLEEDASGSGGVDRRKGSKADLRAQTTEEEQATPDAPVVNDDSDLPPDSSADFECDRPGSTGSSNAHSHAASPLPPLSPGQDQSTTMLPPAPTNIGLSFTAFPTQLQQHHQLSSGSALNTPIHAMHSTPGLLPFPPSVAYSATDAPIAACAADQPTNSIPLGALVCAHPIVRLVEVRNVTRSRLVLRLTTSLDANRPGAVSDVEEMRLYIRNDKHFQSSSDTSQADTASPGSHHSAGESTSPSHGASPLAAAMSASLTAFGSFPQPSPSPGPPVTPSSAPTTAASARPSASLPSHVIDSWLRFMATLLTGEHVALASRFADLVSERSYVKRFILQRRDIDTVLKERLLVPLRESRPADGTDAPEPLLTLEPLETKQLFVYFNLQAQLPTRALATPSSTNAPPTFVTFLNKDFTKNKFIRFDEREVRMRDSQTILPVGETSASIGPAAPTTAVASSLDSSSSVGQAAAGGPSPWLPASGPIDGIGSRAEPGLKVFFQLVQYPTLDEDGLPMEMMPKPMEPTMARALTPSAPTAMLSPIAAQSNAPLAPPVIRVHYPRGPPAPVRSLVFPAYLCRSSLEVAQKHINFGQLLNMNVHSKTLVLSNLSSMPLLFMVKQTGSIASLDITFPKGDIGVIPPHGYTDLPFLFKPSLAGKFLEPITILNVEDASNTRVINVKAYLRKPVHFWIQNLELDFKICCAGGRAPTTADQLQATAPMTKRSNSLTPSASVGSIPSMMTTNMSGALQLPAGLSLRSPITTSTQRIVVKNISLKARTFKIQLIDWEKRMVRAVVKDDTDRTGAVPPGLASALASSASGVGMVAVSADALTSSDSRIVTYYPSECPPELSLACVPSLTLKLEDVALGATLSLFEREEEEEKLNHKLRIAIRKKKTDKVEKIRNRLSELRDMKMEKHSAASGSGGGSSTGDGSTAGATPNKDAGDKSHAHTETHDSMEGLIFTLEPNAVQNVRATFTPVCLPPTAAAAGCADGESSAPSFIEFYTGVLHVYETKNKEIIEEVKCAVAICSDLATQEDYLADTDKWTQVAEEEEPPEEEGDSTEYESTNEEGTPHSLALHPFCFDGDGAQMAPRLLPSSPRSAVFQSEMRVDDEAEVAFHRAKSLPTPHDTPNEKEDEEPMLPLLTESLALLGPRTPLSGTDTGISPSDLLSPHGGSSLPSPNLAPALVPFVPTIGLHHVLMSSPMSVPGSLLPILQFPNSFPTYSSSKSSSALIALGLRSHAKFYEMLYQQNGATNGQLSLPTTSIPPIVSPTPLAVAHREARFPFTIAVPLEFVAALSTLKQDPMTRALLSPPRESATLRARSTPAAERAAATSSSSNGSSRSKLGKSSGAVDSAGLCSPARLLSGTAASIFRVYIEDQVPLSLPSPSFFTLNSHVPTAMILEIKWVPQVADQPSAFTSAAAAASLYGSGGMPVRTSSVSGLQSNSIAPPTPPGAAKHTGGFMRVFVKPGTSLLVPPPAAGAFTASVRPRASASAQHHLPHRPMSLGSPNAMASVSAAVGSTSPVPTPSASLFVLLPANGELDVFMCWLASLLGLTSPALSPQTRPRAKTLRRSSSSVTSGFHTHSSSATMSPVHESEHMASPSTSSVGGIGGGISHRWKKGLDPTVMQEAILLPSKEDVEEGPPEVEVQSKSEDDVMREPMIGRHSVPAGAGARARPALARAVTSTPHFLSSQQSKLPRGQLLIRPVGFPHLRSLVGVEVCSVVGSATHTAVSPLMLTPERLHAGVVLVDMDRVPAGDAPTTSSVSLISATRDGSGIVRGRFVIYNSMTSRSVSRGVGSSGKVTVLLGQQTKNTLTSAFVPPCQRAHFTFRPSRAVIPPNDRRVVEFECHVRTLGHQTHGILVRDVTHDIDMVLPVTFTAKVPTFVQMKDCREGEFNIGLVYAPKHQASAPPMRAGVSTSDATTPAVSPMATPGVDPTTPTAETRFSKVVAFRLENLRDYPVSVKVACNLHDELHVYDGEADDLLLRCLSCPLDQRCAARRQVADALDGDSDRSERSVILAPRSVHTLKLALTPLLTTLVDDADSRRAFIAGLAFSVFLHRTPGDVALAAALPPLKPLSRSSSSVRKVGATRSSVRFIQEEESAADDIIEYDVEASDDDEAERDDVLLCSGDDGRSSDDDVDIGSVTGLTLVPSDLSTDRRLAEMHVRVKAMIGVSALKVDPIGIDEGEGQRASPVTITRGFTGDRPDPTQCVDERSTVEAPRHPRHHFNQPHHRVSTIDFFTLHMPTANQPFVHAPLTYGVQLKNISSLLPLCYRLVASSANVVISTAFGCLAPATPPTAGDGAGAARDSSTTVYVTLPCPTAGLYQEWVSVYVAQQPSLDYRKLHTDYCTAAVDTCTSPHHASDTPHPPALVDGVTDLLGVREELLHTIFLRCFVKDDRVAVDLPELTASDHVRTHHHQLDMGPVYVARLPTPTRATIQPHGGFASPRNAAPMAATPPFIPLQPSRKAARHRLLESILNPSMHAAGATAAMLADTPNPSFSPTSLDKQLAMSPLQLSTPARASSKESNEHGILPSGGIKSSPLFRALHAAAAPDVRLEEMEPETPPINLEEEAYTTVGAVHRAFALRNISSETQWVWLRSDAHAQISVRWAQTPMLPPSDDSPSPDEPEACACGFMAEPPFQLPVVAIQPDGSVALQYLSEQDLPRQESSDALSPESDEFVSHLVHPRQGSDVSELLHTGDSSIAAVNSHLYINSHVGSSGSLISDYHSGLPSMSPANSGQSRAHSRDRSDVRTADHDEGAFSFQREQSFNDDCSFVQLRLPAHEELSKLAGACDDDLPQLASLPSPDYLGEISTEVHGSMCDYHLQTGYDTHPDVPHSLLLHPCCPSMYQLPPGATVFAHTTLTIEEHRLATREQAVALRAGERVDWTSMLTVHTQTMLPSFTTPRTAAAAAVGANSRASAAIRVRAQLVASRSSWELDPQAPGCSSHVSTLVRLATPSALGLYADRFTVYTIHFGKLAADGEPVTYTHRVHNRADIELRVRVMSASLPEYLALHHVRHSTANSPPAVPTDADGAAQQLPAGLEPIAPDSEASPSADADGSSVVTSDPRFIELRVPPLGHTSISLTLFGASMPIGPFLFHIPVFNPRQPNDHAIITCRGEVGPATNGGAHQPSA